MLGSARSKECFAVAHVIGAYALGAERGRLELKQPPPIRISEGAGKDHTSRYA